MALQKQITVRDESKQPRDKKSPNIRTWAAIVLLIIVLFLVVGCVVIWVTVHPKRLDVTVNDGLIKNFTLPNDTFPHLFSVNFTFNFSLENHNYRVGFMFEKMNVTALISTNQTLASLSMPGVFVPPNTTSDSPVKFIVPLSPHEVLLGDPVYTELVSQKKTQEIRVNLTLTSKIMFKPRRWPLDHRMLHIFCNDVMLHYSGEKTYQPTSCIVEL